MRRLPSGLMVRRFRRATAAGAVGAVETAFATAPAARGGRPRRTPVAAAPAAGAAGADAPLRIAFSSFSSASICSLIATARRSCSLDKLASAAFMKPVKTFLCHFGKQEMMLFPQPHGRSGLTEKPFLLPGCLAARRRLPSHRSQRAQANKPVSVQNCNEGPGPRLHFVPRTRQPRVSNDATVRPPPLRFAGAGPAPSRGPFFLRGTLSRRFNDPRPRRWPQSADDRKPDPSWDMPGRMSPPATTRASSRD